jgi:hypothetical protein
VDRNSSVVKYVSTSALTASRYLELAGADKSGRKLVPRQLNCGHEYTHDLLLV